jgi:hypothetical protein
MSQIKTKIPREALLLDRWYVGRGRNANVGLWDGKYFLTIGEKCGRMVVRKETYYATEAGAFQPFLLIDEGSVIEKVADGSKLFYADKLAFSGFDQP